MDRIADIRCGRTSLLLREPYVTAHATLKAFDVVWVWVRLESGEMGIGEAVALSPGYGRETPDDVWEGVSVLVAHAGRSQSWDWPDYTGVTPDEAAHPFPFARSALLCACQMAHHARRGWDEQEWPLVAPSRRRKASGACGFDNGPEWSGTVDYNESCTVPPHFGKWGPIAGRWVVEQPYRRTAWRAHARLAQRLDVRLDESIWTERDIRDAALIDCGVKLKACKFGGIDELVSALRYDNVESIGNGVATDITAVSEMLAVARSGAELAPLECNGWTRTVAGPLLFDVGRGASIRLPPSSEVQARLVEAVAVLEAM